jgi:DNA-directed RNA polymerase specialized sigma24 family protein
MSPMRPADGPSRRELEQVTEQVRPDLEELFRRHGTSQVDAERLLREALVRLAYQWGRIRNRSWWLLDALENAARELAQPSIPEDFGDD